VDFAVIRAALWRICEQSQLAPRAGAPMITIQARHLQSSIGVCGTDDTQFPSSFKRKDRQKAPKRSARTALWTHEMEIFVKAGKGLGRIMLKRHSRTQRFRNWKLGPEAR